MRPAFLPVALLVACGAPRDTDQQRLSPSVRGPVATVVDSVELHEPDSLPLSNYAWPVARGGDGEVFVLDPSARRIWHFDAGGTFVGIFGRAGEGPGELRSPIAIALLPGDSLIAVADPNRSRMLVFSASVGTFRREAELPEFAMVDQHWTWRGDTASFGLTASRTPIAVWWSKGDSLVTRGVTPKRTRVTGPEFGLTTVVATDSGFAVLYPAQPGLFFLDRSGNATGFVPVPAVRRLGEPGDLRARQKALSKAERGRLVASMVSGLHRLVSGEWLLIHLDVDVSRTADDTRGRNLRFYASVMSADLQRVCVDGLLPVSSDAPARPFFSADTLFLFSRTVGPTGMNNRLYGLTVSTATCDWQETGGIVPPPRDSL